MEVTSFSVPLYRQPNLPMSNLGCAQWREVEWDCDHGRVADRADQVEGEPKIGSCPVPANPDSGMYDLNESEISDDAGDVYLFQWLSSTEGRLSKVSTAELKMKQSSLEKTFVKVISGNENYPQPGRAIRNLIGRCFVLLYTRGETRSMFDNLQSLLKIVGDLKAVDKVVVKTAAFSCIGDIMAVFGSQVMSFMAEICVVTIKTFKSSSSCLLRYHALIALAKSLRTAKKAVQDSSVKDIVV